MNLHYNKNDIVLVGLLIISLILLFNLHWFYKPYIPMIYILTVLAGIGYTSYSGQLLNLEEQKKLTRI